MASAGGSGVARVVLVGGAAAGASRIKARLPEVVLDLVDPVTGDLRAALVEADAVVASALGRSELATASRLRLIQALGAGTDEIDLAAVPDGCALCNVYEHEVAIGEWALMVMLALTRRLLPYDRDLRHGRWGAGHTFSGLPEVDLRGCTVGIIGTGTIGGEVARLARAVGMEAIGVTLHPDDARRDRLGLRWLGPISALSDLLREADFAVVAVPLTPETRGLVGAAELALLGPSGYLLNVARGPVVDEQALYDALVAGTIAGAGLDVWYRYPDRPEDETSPAHLPFGELDNVVMTPHVSGFARSTFERRWELIVDQVVRLVDGRPFRNLLGVGPPATQPSPEEMEPR